MAGLTVKELQEKRYGSKKVSPWQKFMKTIAPQWIAYQENIKLSITFYKKHPKNAAAKLFINLAGHRNQYVHECLKHYKKFLDEQCNLAMITEITNNGINVGDIAKLADKEKRHAVMQKRKKFSKPEPVRVSK